MLGESNVIFGARGLYEREQAEFQIREGERATISRQHQRLYICLRFI